MDSLSPAQIQALRKLAVERAQASLVGYTRYLGEHIPAKHHEIMCAGLELAAMGRLSRLMIFAPPGAAKSTYGTVLMPSWAIGRRPNLAILSASHTQQLADSFGRRVRAVLRSERYADLFPNRIDKESSSARRWGTVTAHGQGGTYLAAGVNVGIAGFRADVGIIDDPVRSREDADSETIREKTWEWYLTDFLPRLKPVSSITIINTRWHEDDICGRILPEGYHGESGWIKARDGEWWFVISIQALAERTDDILDRTPGESYWPGYYTQDILEQARIVQTPRNWAALYQQRPSPEEGDYYQRAWFQWYDELPQHCRFYGASDYAVTSKGGDHTSHIVGAVAGPVMIESLYLCDYWTGQADPSVWISKFIDLVRAWKPVQWAEETGQISKSLGSTIDLEQQRAVAWCHRVQLSVAGDKAQRAQAFRALAAQGRVFLPRQAPWAKDFLERLLRWQSTGRDDDHDACGLLARQVYEMRGGAAMKPRTSGPAHGTYDWLMKVTDPDHQKPVSPYRSH